MRAREQNTSDDTERQRLQDQVTQDLLSFYMAEINQANSVEQDARSIPRSLTARKTLARKLRLKSTSSEANVGNARSGLGLGAGSGNKKKIGNAGMIYTYSLESLSTEYSKVFAHICAQNRTTESSANVEFRRGIEEIARPFLQKRLTDVRDSIIEFKSSEDKILFKKILKDFKPIVNGIRILANLNKNDISEIFENVFINA